MDCRKEHVFLQLQLTWLVRLDVKINWSINELHTTRLNSTQVNAIVVVVIVIIVLSIDKHD